VKKSRTLLLLGAFAIMTSLCGCMATMIQTSKDWTAQLTGAKDPNNTSLTAQAGRLEIAGTNLAAQAVGIETKSPVIEAAPAAAAPPPVPKPPVAAAPKKVVKKSPSPSVQPVAATAADMKKAK